MQYLGSILALLGAFLVISLASERVGTLFARFRLPLISGFLFTGMLAGPYVLGLIPETALPNLRFVDHLSLGFIAFAAGSELYLKELRDRGKSIAWQLVGQILGTFLLGTAAVVLLAGSMPFLEGMERTGIIAVAIIAGAILLARSPASAIAVINEVRARGPMTYTILGVTVIKDVVVITLFALNVSIADALLTGTRIDLGFLLLILVELGLACVLAVLVALALAWLLARDVHPTLKTAAILAGGFGVFLLSARLRSWTHAHLQAELLVEPLLVCMIAGFLVTNFSRHRAEFARLLHDVGPYVYIVFFTLTGASLQLDLLVKIWGVALAVFAARIAGIFLGCLLGGISAGDPMRHNRVSWMAYITQAGVGLGLAKEIAGEFPDWGPGIATLLISVIVLNQIAGPPLFKWALSYVGESRKPAPTRDFDSEHDALIFGLEPQSLQLARQLARHGWNVKVASRAAGGMEEEVARADVDIHPIRELSLETLKQLETGKVEAIIAMLSDEENYRIAELAYEHFGTNNVVVRLNDRAEFGRFRELGALVVDPSTAMVSLLEHFTRSPSAASLFLGLGEGDQDILDAQLRNPGLDGIRVRDLRLPLDTLVLAVRRDGRSLISHGYTRLEVGDWITLVGSRKSLSQIVLRFQSHRIDEEGLH